VGLGPEDDAVTENKLDSGYETISCDEFFEFEDDAINCDECLDNQPPSNDNTASSGIQPNVQAID
jgi:hypothetical protein